MLHADDIQSKYIFQKANSYIGNYFTFKQCIFQHQILYYKHRRIYTALKMPPAVFTPQMFSDACLHKLGT